VTGQLTFPRGKDRDDQDAEQLRFSVDEYNGTRYVSARVWYRDGGGDFKPTKRGITIRAREMQDVISWFMDAEKALAAPAEGESNRDWVKRQSRQPAPKSARPTQAAPDLDPAVEEALF
jgi:hypothetical protein